MNMRVLVTGATGFVGSHCLQALTGNKEVQVIAACRDESRLPDGFAGTVCKGDLQDQGYLDTLCKDVDVIIHAAAWTALWKNKQHSDALFFQPSIKLLESAQRAGVSRFIFVSTVSAPEPEKAHDPMSPGVKRSYWPHEANVVRIEEAMKRAAGDDFCMVNMRLGLFAGARYALGLLPVLVPRLKTRLVPWIAGGRTLLPIIDGRDVGAVMALAATAPNLAGFQSFNAVGPEVPTVFDVISYLHEKYGLPKPFFDVPFPAAFAFAWLMEKMDFIFPFEPLVTRSIVHLLQHTNLNNDRAIKELGYKPRHHWQQAIDIQMAEMSQIQKTPMKLARPLGESGA